MGPSVKFVLPMIDAFPNKKNGGNFWCGKKGRNGGGRGGSEGVAFFGRKFSRLSFLNTSLRDARLAPRKNRQPLSDNPGAIFLNSKRGLDSKQGVQFRVVTIFYFDDEVVSIGRQEPPC